jgi:hypothetical protein
MSARAASPSRPGAEHDGARKNLAEFERADDLDAGVEGCDRQHRHRGKRRQQQEEQVLARQSPLSNAFDGVHCVPDLSPA